MSNRLYLVVAGLIAIWPAAAQSSQQRRASMRGGGNGNEGKCTIEVVVDGVADVEIRGDTANLRTLSGQTAQWRRFECDGRMPNNPANFRFQGVDGRGRQELVRDPRGGGPAVVRIEDSKGGSEGYTFDIMWSGGQGGPGYSDYPRYPQGDRNYGGRFSTEQAIRVCQDEVRQRAAQRFRGADIRFNSVRIDDNPGRRDWVVGDFETAGGFGRRETHRFSCSVNFDNGSVRSVDIEGGETRGNGRGFDSGAAIRACQRAAEESIRGNGYRSVEFDSINVDNGPGGNDRVVGSARGFRGNGSDAFRFTCRVNLDNGSIRSVDVNRR